jgi:hypothetical protein
MVILQGVVAKDWREDWILVGDNDNAHGTMARPTTRSNSSSDDWASNRRPTVQNHLI